MSGGVSNVASGNNAVAFGIQNSATGFYSAMPGGSLATDHGFLGKNCYASGSFVTNVAGSAQSCQGVLRGLTATAAAIRLTSDATAAGAGNCLNLPAATAYALTLSVTALDITNPVNSVAWLGWNGLIARQTTPGSTTVGMAATPTPISNGTVAGSAIAAIADLTNGCLNLSFTPPTANADTWHAVARVQAVEVQ
jgi:hypothetical protein